MSRSPARSTGRRWRSAFQYHVQLFRHGACSCRLCVRRHLSLCDGRRYLGPNGQYQRRERVLLPRPGDTLQLPLEYTGEKRDEAANSGGLPREKTNVDQGKESNCQARADNQHNQRRSIEKARSRLDRRLDDVSSFFVHKTATRSGPYHNRWAQNRFQRARLIRPLADWEPLCSTSP